MDGEAWCMAGPTQEADTVASCLTVCCVMPRFVQQPLLRQAFVAVAIPFLLTIHALLLTSPARRFASCRSCSPSDPSPPFPSLPGSPCQARILQMEPPELYVRQVRLG